MANLHYDPALAEQMVNKIIQGKKELHGTESKVKSGISKITKAKGANYIYTGEITSLLGLAEAKIDALDNLKKDMTEQIKNIEDYNSNKQEFSFLHRLLATRAFIELKFLEGVLSGCEQIFDGVATLTGLFVGIFSPTAKEKIANFIAPDYFGDMFDKIYESDKFHIADASYLKKDGFVGWTLEFAGSLAPYIALSVVGGQAIAAAGIAPAALGTVSSLATPTLIHCVSAPVLAGAITAGVGTVGGMQQSQLQSGKTFDESIGTSLMWGGISAGASLIIGSAVENYGPKIASFIKDKIHKTSVSNEVMALNQLSNQGDDIITKAAAHSKYEQLISQTDDILNQVKNGTLSSSEATSMAENLFKEMPDELSKLLPKELYRELAKRLHPDSGFFADVVGDATAGAAGGVSTTVSEGTAAAVSEGAAVATNVASSAGTSASSSVGEGAVMTIAGGADNIAGGVSKAVANVTTSTAVEAASTTTAYGVNAASGGLYTATVAGDAIGGVGGLSGGLGSAPKGVPGGGVGSSSTAGTTTSSFVKGGPNATLSGTTGTGPTASLSGGANSATSELTAGGIELFTDGASEMAAAGSSEASVGTRVATLTREPISTGSTGGYTFSEVSGGTTVYGAASETSTEVAGIGTRTLTPANEPLTVPAQPDTRFPFRVEPTPATVTTPTTTPPTKPAPIPITTPTTPATPTTPTTTPEPNTKPAPVPVNVPSRTPVEVENPLPSTVTDQHTTPLVQIDPPTTTQDTSPTPVPYASGSRTPTNPVKITTGVTDPVSNTTSTTPVDPGRAYPTPIPLVRDSKPTPVDPTPVDPTPVDPTPVDPTPVDPTPVDPTPVDPTPVDPTPVDPTPVDPTPVDPTPVDPTPVDPTPVDPTPVDPTPVDPTPVDPTPVDPTPVDPNPEPSEYAPIPYTGFNDDKNFADYVLPAAIAGGVAAGAAGTIKAIKDNKDKDEDNDEKKSSKDKNNKDESKEVI